MNEQTLVSQPSDNSLHSDIDGFDSLAELALDLHWSGNHSTDEVWRQLDAGLQKYHPQSPWKRVACFPREYMLNEAPPIHSGGLGDVLPRCNDVSIPLEDARILGQR
jgi:starch phosphorylase